MNGIDFVADTNILLYILEENPATEPLLPFSFAVSFISEMELLGYVGITDAEAEAIKSILSDCVQINLTNEIKSIAIEMKQNQKIKLPDAIIAATAIHLRVPLVTADKKLSKVKNLNCLIIEPE